MAKTKTTINSKLEGIPQIRYLNLDARVDRNSYMEHHLKEYGITDYVRISADRYGPNNYEEWKKLLTLADYEKYIRKNSICYVSILVNQLQSIIDWYNENTSETCIIAEDDLSLLPCRYWPFDWKYFVSNLPCNWDCVQLQIIGGSYIPMGFTKRTKNNHGATAYLINRRYAEKLISMHYVDGKFKFYNNYGYSKYWPEYHYQSPDFVPYEIGVTYSFPIFVTNNNFGSDCYDGRINGMAKKSDYVVAQWWKDSAQHYSLGDIFSVNSSKTRELMLPVYYDDYDTGKAYGHEHRGE